MLNLFSVLLLVGCSAGVDGDSNGNSTEESMILHSLSSSSIQELYEGAGSVTRPTHKSFLVKACFKENIYLEPIRNQNFVVNSVKAIETKSDVNGCVHWTEKVEMKSSFKLRYKKFERLVSTEAPFKGSFVVKFAFNIFDNKFVDLQLGNIPADQFIPSGQNELKVDFDLTDMTLYFGGYDTPHDDSRSEKRVITKWMGCFKYKADMTSISNQILEVKVMDDDNNVIHEFLNKTDLKGCLRNNIYTTYDQFEPVKWFSRHLVVRALDGPLEGQVLKRNIFINPWVNGRNHGWDSRAGDPPQNPVGEKARLHLDRVNYTFLGNLENGYQVNRYLDLSVSKSYLIEMTPKINRGHSFSTNRIIEEIYTGQFKLKVSVVSATKGDVEITSESIDGFDFISGAEKIVEVINGKIITTIDLPFRFDQLLSSASRTIAIIELAAVDSAVSDLQPVIVSGKFLASSHQLSVGLRPHNRDFKTDSSLAIGADILGLKLDEIRLLNQQKELSSKWKGSPLEIFKEIHKDNPNGQKPILSLKRSRLAPFIENKKVAPKELEILLANSGKKEVLNKFCGFFFKKKLVEGLLWDSYQYPREYHLCLRNPGRYIKASSFKHIEKILSKPQKIYTSSDRFNIGTGFLVYNGESRRTSTSRRVSFGGGISAKLEIPFLKFLSIGGGVNADIAKIWSRDESTGTTSRGQFARSRNLHSDHLKLGFDAEVEHCVLIEGREYETVDTRSMGLGFGLGFSGNVATVKKFPKERLHVCKDSAVKEWLEESWYYIGEHRPTNSILRDPWSVSENYLGKIIRGEENYELFYNLMTDDTKVIFLEKVETMRGNDDYLQRYYQGKTKPVLEDMAIPGTIQSSSF